MSTPAQHLRSITDEDGAVILDIKRDSMIGMNAVASYVWNKLQEGLPVSHIIEDLAQETGENPAIVDQDVREFIQELKNHQMLEATPSTPASMRDQTLRALLFLFAYDLLLLWKWLVKQNFFAMLHSRVRRWRVAPRSTSDLESVCEAVHVACSWYPKQVLCLQRSAVTTCVLRDQGFFAELVIGAQKMPFYAHAWVEVEGRIVNDKPATVSQYKVLERC